MKTPTRERMAVPPPVSGVCSCQSYLEQAVGYLLTFGYFLPFRSRLNNYKSEHIPSARHYAECFANVIS